MEWLEFAPWSNEVVRELAVMHAVHPRPLPQPKPGEKKTRAEDRAALSELLAHTEPRNPWGEA